MNTDIYEELLCDNCKVRIVEETKKLKGMDKYRPMKMAKKAREWVCTSCYAKIEARLNRRGSR